MWTPFSITFVLILVALEIFLLVKLLELLKTPIRNRYLKRQTRAFIREEGLKYCMGGSYNGKEDDLARYLGIERDEARTLIFLNLEEPVSPKKKIKKPDAKRKPLYTRELFEKQFPQREE